MGRKPLALALAVAALGLAGCGDDGEPEPAATADPTTASATAPVSEAGPEEGSPESAVAGFYEDLAAGELDAACAWWTTDYAATSVQDWNERDYGPDVQSCPELLREVTEVIAIVGDPAEQLAVTDLRSEVEGGNARVEVTLASADQPETYLLTRGDDGWLISGHELGRLAPDPSPNGG